MAGEEAAAAPRPASNANYYMKSAIFSMVSLTIATKAVDWLTGKEPNIVCEPGVNDYTWFGKRYESLRFFDPKKTHHETQYVAMSDGIELAVDTYLAEFIHESNQTAPAIVHYTRHGRGYTVDFPFNMFTQYEEKFTNPRTNLYVQRFVSNGYVWVAVDVRGTGASAGSKKHDFNDQEITDGYEIIEWITKQPWSNGQVGAFGHGMEGVGALLMAASKHPALKAVTLNGAPVDIYQSAFYPGGVKNFKGLNDYASFTYDTDRQIRWRNIPALRPRLMMKYFGGNVYPVDDNQAQFANYIAQHANNPNLTEELESVRFRDDTLKNVGVTFHELDIIRHLGEIASSGVAIHSFAGYYDMGVAKSSILLFQYLTGTLDKEVAKLLPKLPEGVDTDPYRHRLTLGPWSHAGTDNTDPFAQSKKKCFWHLEEISRFFDHHLYSNRHVITKLNEDEPIHYYTVVQSAWKSAVTWPPAHIGEETFYLGPDQSMESVYTAAGEVTLDVAHNSAYDVVSRWDMIDHLFGLRPFYYHDRAPMVDTYVAFLTPELTLLELTGEVELRLFFSVDKPAVNLVAYLEDVDYQPLFPNENKRAGVTYITEALLNPIHQPVSKDSSVYSYLKKDSREIVPNVVYEAVLKFQPVSYIVKRNHQLRLTVGVATRADFAPAGPEEATKLTIHFGGEYPSSLKLPTYEGVYKANIVPKEEEEEGVESIATSETAGVPAGDAEEDEFASTDDKKDEL